VVNNILQRLLDWLIFCTGDLGALCLLNAADEGKVKLALNVDYNRVDCDCRDYSLISQNRFFVFGHFLDRVNCDTPSELYSQKVCVHVSRKKPFALGAPFKSVEKNNIN